jgi:DNA-binding NtrC family response regulator
MKQKFPDIPVAVVSAVRDDALVETCFRNGACEYLFLPFEREQLLLTVRRAMKHRQ